MIHSHSSGTFDADECPKSKQLKLKSELKVHLSRIQKCVAWIWNWFELNGLLKFCDAKAT